MYVIIVAVIASMCGMLPLRSLEKGITVGLQNNYKRKMSIRKAMCVIGAPGREAVGLSCAC